MKHYFNVDNFFRPLRLEHPVSDDDYANIRMYIEALSALARIANMSMYVIDYHKKGFLYVSSNPLFLCGYERDDVRRLGYGFYSKALSPEDLSMLLELNEKGFEYFYKQDIENRCDLLISYDFQMNHKNGYKFMVNHKLTPLVLTSDGDMWLSLCLVTHSIQEKSGNAYIQHFNKPGRREEYSFRGKRWKESTAIVLTEQERKVLLLTAQGYTTQNVADKLFIGLNTVKFHKTNILTKLEVKNMIEAVYFATVNQLI